MKHYFFKGKTEKGEKLRIYPVSGQLKGSDVINEKLRVSCPRSVRSMDLSTVYVSDDIFPTKTRKYYTVKNFRVLPESLKAEWEAFSKPIPEVEGVEVKEEVKEEGPKKEPTLYEKLVTDKAMCAPTSDVDGFFIKQEDWSLLARNVQKHINTMILGPAGTGKCLGKDTPVLMYDGTIKMVQDVVVGDQLMGPDSKPRNVLSTTTGREELFKITPNKGDSWVCNKSHILSLKRTNDGTSLVGKIENVSITDYLNWSKDKKKNHKQWRCGVDFPEKELQLDPYFLGLWLGDGFTREPVICSADQEVVDFIYEYAKSLGCTVTKRVEPSKANSYRIVQKDKHKGIHTEIINRMNFYNLRGNKHIPADFLYNSRENRLKLFAGLMDTDGYYYSGCFEYSTKLDNLKDDVVYLSRSLGFFVSTSVKTVKGKSYWRLNISGDFKDVPTIIPRKKTSPRKQRKSVLVTGITVESIGVGDYYGFTIDGDHLFMLGDFTVTHNTSVVKVLCDRLGLKLHIFDMGSMMDPISSLLGVHRLEDGGSIFDYAKFTQVIQEPCVILLDELSRAPQSAMNILFPCLDDRRSLSIEIACGKGVREIKIHPEVTFIATANVGAEYSGTNSMDRALVNRFFTLELGYIPAKEESAVLSKRTGITKEASDMIVKVAGNIRNLASKQEVSSSPSIRETLMVAELVADGWTLGQAMQMVYLPLYEGTKSEGERGTIYKTLSSY